MKSFVNILFNSTVRILTIVVALPVLWLVEPFWRFRFSAMHEDHIGNLSKEIEDYARHIRANGMAPRTTHVFMAWNPSNRQLLAMWKRHLTIIESYLLRRASRVFLPILEQTRFFCDIRGHQEMTDILMDGPSVLCFTDEEEQRGRRALAEMGVGPDDWFVCFHSRDSGYYAERFARKASFRDCDIGNYIPAMQHVVAEGGVAIRVGAHVDHPIQDGLGPKIVDYASDCRSDFMDVYLMAKCRFFIGNTSGIMCVASIFNVPMGLANYTPLTHTGESQRSLIIPKMVYNRRENRLLTYAECWQMGFFDGSPEAYLPLQKGNFPGHAELEWLQNSSEDILDLCQDVLDWTQSRPPPNTEEAARIQSEYLKFQATAFPQPPSPIGPRFALKHRDMIEPEDVDGNIGVPSRPGSS
ncbi:MAG: TIGR04372 family glycosyltransferase [Alphaproteobacteria bacterium]